jgi:hypothetical protein
MLRDYLLPTPRVDRYWGRSPVLMRPGGSPGPRSPFVGSGWTRTDQVERVFVAGSARARAHDIARTAPRTTWPNRAPTGAVSSLGLLPPTAHPCACPSVPGVSARFEMRARTTNWRANTSGSPLAASGRFRVQLARPVACRGAPAAAGLLPPVPALVGMRIVSRASVPPRLHQYPNTRCQCSGRAND